MSFDSAPEPADRLDPGPVNWEELLLSERAHARELQQAHEELVAHIGRMRQPARVEAIELTVNNNPAQSSSTQSSETVSVGLLNPTAELVQFSVVGTASAVDAYKVAAGKFLVLPIAVPGPIEIFTTAALAGPSDARFVFLFRFATVQPAFIGG